MTCCRRHRRWNGARRQPWWPRRASRRPAAGVEARDHYDERYAFRPARPGLARPARKDYVFPMKAEDVLGLLVPVTFVFLFVTEKLFPRREYPPIRFWNLIGFGCLIMTGLLSTFLPLLLPPSVTQYHLFDGARLGMVGVILVAYPLSALGSALLH